jgi:hypothetical protein
VDRSSYPTRRLLLKEEGRDDDVAAMTPAQRVAMVWPLTVQAWTFMQGHFLESRLRRDVVRVVRGPR